MSRISSLLFVITLLLSIIGLFFVYESSSYSALYYLGDKYHFINNQLIWFVVGMIICLAASFFDYKKLYNLSLPLMFFTLILLILVFVPGLGMRLKGAARWIDLRFLVVQPSELLKISLTLYLAAWLSNKEQGRLIAFLILIFISGGLIILQPDMGTATIVAVTSIIVYFLSGSNLKEMFIIFMILLISSVFLIKVAPYRMQRLTSFTNFNINSISDSTYHVKQILIAEGTGGLTGAGFGKSIQKYAYLPESSTDSIFAIIAEEVGFVGSSLLVLMFLFQFCLGLIIALRTSNQFGKLLAVGIITFIAAQTLINLASQAVLIPLTGVPLPFISYGGSSMLINFLSIGILLNIGNNIAKKNVSTLNTVKRRERIKI